MLFYRCTIAVREDYVMDKDRAVYFLYLTLRNC
jgi:hypothetical protein